MVRACCLWRVRPRISTCEHPCSWSVHKALKRGAEGGTRTHTGFNSQRFLRPPRLPFRHFGTKCNRYIIATTVTAVNVSMGLLPKKLFYISIFFSPERYACGSFWNARLQPAPQK